MKNVFLGLLCILAVSLANANSTKESIPYEEVIENCASEVFDAGSIMTISYSIVEEGPASCKVTVTFDNGCGSSGTFTVTSDTCAAAMATANLILSFVPAC